MGEGHTFWGFLGTRYLLRPYEFWLQDIYALLATVLRGVDVTYPAPSTPQNPLGVLPVAGLLSLHSDWDRAHSPSGIRSPWLPSRFHHHSLIPSGHPTTVRVSRSYSEIWSRYVWSTKSGVLVECGVRSMIKSWGGNAKADDMLAGMSGRQ